MSSIEILLEKVGDLKRELRGVEQALGQLGGDVQAKDAGETSEEGHEALQAIKRKALKVLRAAEELADAAKKIEGT